MGTTSPPGSAMVTSTHTLEMDRSPPTAGCFCGPATTWMSHQKPCPATTPAQPVKRLYKTSPLEAKEWHEETSRRSLHSREAATTCLMQQNEASHEGRNKQAAQDGLGVGVGVATVLSTNRHFSHKCYRSNSYNRQMPAIIHLKNNPF